MAWILHSNGTFAGLTAATLPVIIGNPPGRFYLSGDGHGQPPFQWAVKPAVLEMFLTLMSEGNLCLHVEQLPEDVTCESIPPLFDPVFVQGKVFGWELPMYRLLLPVMQKCLEMASNEGDPTNIDVNAMHDDLVRMAANGGQVNNPPWLAAAVATSTTYKTYCTDVNRFAINPLKIERVPQTDSDYKKFLHEYYKDAMRLRIGANNFIGINIMHNIAKFPAATHLITVGNAHIHDDPVQNYILIPAQENGHIDAIKD